jgi:hypothetical protein
MKKFCPALAVMAVVLAGRPALPQGAKPLRITVGPEQIILPKGLQPFMFQSRKGTLVVQGQAPAPHDFVAPKYAWGWYPGTIRSTDRGRTWAPWKPAATQGLGPIFEGTGAEFKDGTIVMLSRLAKSSQPEGYFVSDLWESHDDWQTLIGPLPARIYLPEAVVGFADNEQPAPGITLHRAMIVMPNGDLLATAYGWFKGDSTPSEYQPTMNKFRCFLLRSKDRGRNWVLASTIAVDPTVGQEGFDEPVLVRLAHGRHRGRFIVLMRTGRFNPLYQTESDDDGQTWTKPHELPFHGVSPDLVEMKNGILVAGFGWRTRQAFVVAKDPTAPVDSQLGFYLAFSRDQGATWTQVTQVNNELTTSYAALAEAQPGELILVYDKGWWGHSDRALAARFIQIR